MTPSEYVPGEALTIPEGQTIAAYRAEKVAARIAATQPRYPGAVLGRAVAFIALHPVPRSNHKR